MSSIITDNKKIDFTLSAITIFCPNGKIISINKIKNYKLHIEYLITMRKNCKELKKLLEKIDLEYYRNNPSDVMNDIIISILIKEGYAVYLNLAPNTTFPTNNALMFLPETITNSIKSKLEQLKEKLESIIFQDIAQYNEKLQDIETHIEIFQEEANGQLLYEIINKTDIKSKQKEKINHHTN